MKIKVHRGINLFTVKAFLVKVCALTCVFGEKMNTYIPGASLAFTIAGMVLVVVNLLAPNRIYYKLDRNDGINLRLVESIVIISLFISLLKISFGFYSSVFDELRQFILSLIAMNIVTVMMQDKCLLCQFMKLVCFSFSITFVASYSFLYNDVRHTGFYKDPNSMARVAVLCFFFAIYLFLNSKKRFTRIFWLISMSIGVGAIFLSGSRGCFGGLLVCGIYLFFTSHIKPRYKIVLVTCVVIVSLILWMGSENNNEYKMMILRYLGTNNTTEDGYSSNIRWKMWATYVSNIKDYFWIGNFDGIPKSYYMYYRSSHNSLMEMMVNYGVFAFLAFLILQIRLLLKKINGNSLGVIMKCLYITLFISSMFISTNDEKISWLSIMFMMIPTREERNMYC